MAQNKVVIRSLEDFKKPGIIAAFQRWQRYVALYQELQFMSQDRWETWIKDHPEVPFDAIYDKDVYDQYMQHAGQEGYKQEELPSQQHRRNHFGQSHFAAPAKEKTTYLEEDKRYQAIVSELKQQWKQQHPQEATASSDKTEAGQDIPTFKSEAERIFEERFPAAAKEYANRARVRIYADPLLDPVFREVEENILRKAGNDPANSSANGWDIISDTKTLQKAWEWDTFVEKYPEKAAAYADNNPDVGAAFARYKKRQLNKQEAEQKRKALRQEITAKSNQETTISPEDISSLEDASFIDSVLPSVPEDTEEDIPMDWHEEDGPVVMEDMGDNDSDEESSGSSPSNNLNRLQKLTELGEEAEGAETAALGSEAALGGAEMAATNAGTGALTGEIGAAALGAEGAGAALAGGGVAGTGGAIAATTAAPEVAVVAGGASGVLVPALAIAGVAIILIFIIVAFLNPGISGTSGASAAALLKITKTGPTSIPNPSGTPTPLNYQIAVDYPSNAQDVLVKDTLPQGTTLSSATQPYTTETDASGNTAVTWSLSQLSGGIQTATTGTAQQTVDTTKYTEPPYSLPAPKEDPDISYSQTQISALNELGATVAKYQSYLLTKIKNNDPKYVDPFLSVIWSGAIEGTYGNNYSWNCLDKESQNTINAGCSGGFISGDWQVSYGVQVADAANALADDFNAVYGDGAAQNTTTVQQVGQQVISDYASSHNSSAITNPAAFPKLTISDLVSKAKGGDTGAQQAIAILLMDKNIGAISTARAIAGNIGSKDNWVSTMEGWAPSYGNNMQLYANRMQTLAKTYTLSGTTTTSSGELDQLSTTINISLLPDASLKDTYLINQATAELVGTTTTDTTQTGSNTAGSSLPPLTGNLTANTSTCNGKYSLGGGSHNGENFGDPTCELAQSPSSPFSAVYPADPATPNRSENLPSLLATDLNQLDPANASKWEGISLCESDYDPNAVAQAVNSTAYGLFQMAGGSVGNGQYDKGDVQWRSQTSNAIDYNNKVLKPLGLTWRYWECAERLGLWVSTKS